ncbi:olfactory receptor 2AT4-like [Periophthalmus magnuspinnatus]|uniref:olfactory receptor 2AT4-like n=1 Tax=Periophthalmus magnuspinnatus TaxID=409849 RepID=UPI0024363B5E|nr:olfactory receptor 2AT4-like [Periophthalmus magnuspinnatus]
MQYNNGTRINHFFITGFPGLSAQYYAPVSLLLFITFLAIAFGNILILVLVKCERSLHKPTYLIFCHLASTDLAFGIVILPKIISKYWFDDSLIEFNSCFVQMFFVHFLASVHSFILMIMALDRFLAISFPLHYPSAFTNTTASVLCGVSWFLALSCMIFIVIDALTLPYCNSNVIVQCYCDHYTITTLSCDPRPDVQAFATGSAMFVLLVPLTFIIASYFSIIVVVVRISSHESRMKTFSTCTPQLLITLLYYTPRCFVYLAAYVGFGLSLPNRIVVVMLYSVIPAEVNPLIYCFKTKDIKECLSKRYKMAKVYVGITEQ